MYRAENLAQLSGIMHYFYLHFNLSPASSFIKESPQEIIQVTSQIFCVSNPITISLRDLGTLAECWKTASFLLTGLWLYLLSVQLSSLLFFPGSFWEMVFMGSKGFSLMALTMISTVEERSHCTLLKHALFWSPHS